MYNSNFFTDQEITTFLGIVLPTTPAIDSAIIEAVGRSESLMQDFLQNDYVYKLRTEFVPSSQIPGDPGSVSYPTIYVNVSRLASPHPNFKTLSLCHLPIVIDESFKLWHDPNAKGGQSDGSFSQELEIGKDFYIDSEDGVVSNTGLIYIEESIVSYPRSVKVEYHSGISDMTKLKSLKAALEIITIHWFRIIVSSRVAFSSSCKSKTPRGPVSSESFDGYSYSVNSQLEIGLGFLAGGPIPTAAAAILQPYRNYRYM